MFSRVVYAIEMQVHTIVSNRDAQSAYEENVDWLPKPAPMLCQSYCKC